MIQNSRIKILNNKPVNSDGDYVVYWMQQSQRTVFNHALEFAVIKANELNKKLIVFFGITSVFPDANERHYYFMLEGLIDVNSALIKRGISFIVQIISPEKGILEISEKACLTVCDKGYLYIQRKWRNDFAEKSVCKVYEIESDTIVPVETASVKEDYSAGTIRKKIHLNMLEHMIPVNEIKLKTKSLDIKIKSEKILYDTDIKKIISKLKPDSSVKKSVFFKGGQEQAFKNLDFFIKNNLRYYGIRSNDPSENLLSNLSPYLHFGHISPLYVALQVEKESSAGKLHFLEELIVRRELAINFVYYNRYYDSFKCLNEWCKQTLISHIPDKRDYIYSLEELENHRTHDIYWNSAQKEMVITGKMHGYMRMYWGKKIIEWTDNPETAYKYMVYLNNKYEIDGRDPNGYAGIAWCFGKHDRAWTERNIFGKIRYMNDKGLERKFEINKYCARISEF